MEGGIYSSLCRRCIPHFLMWGDRQQRLLGGLWGKKRTFLDKAVNNSCRGQQKMGSAQKYCVLLTGRVGAATRRGGGGLIHKLKRMLQERGRQTGRKCWKRTAMVPCRTSWKSLVEAGVRSRFCGCEGVSDRGDTSSLIKCETI